MKRHIPMTGLSRIPPLVRGPGSRKAAAGARPALGTTRRGAAMVETALVLNIYMLLILGTCDLGIAVHRNNTLSQAARHGARQASVHGALAAPSMAAWGPATYTGTAGDGSIWSAQNFH